MTKQFQDKDSVDILFEVKKQFFSHVKLRLGSFFDSLKGIHFVFEQNAGEDYKQSLNNVAIKTVIDHQVPIDKNFFASLESVFKYFHEGNFDFFINANLTIGNYQQVTTRQNEGDEMAIISMLINNSDDENEDKLNKIGNMFSELADDKSLTINQIPVSPFVMVNSLVNSVKNLDLNSAIRMIVYHTFEVNVLSKLSSIYESLLKPYNKNNIDLHLNEKVEVIDPAPDLKFIIVRKLFERNHNKQLLKNDKEFIVEKHLLVKMLNMIQLKISKKYDSNLNDYPAPKSIKLILKKTIFNTTTATITKSAKSAKSVKLDQRHEDIIFLIEKLFEYIDKDQSIPIVLKSILMKLQASVLKVAIQDSHVFKYQTHPLRLLINYMSYVPAGFNDELNWNHRYIIKLIEIANVISIQSTYNVTLYENLLNELNQFIWKMNNRFNLIQKRVKEKAIGLGKIQLIKQKVATILDDKMHDKYMPVFIRDLLLKTWKNVLVLEFLRHPEDSKTCQSKVKFIESLLKYTQVRTDQIVTIKDIKILSIQFKEGLNLVAFNAKDLIDKNNVLMGFLIKLHDLEEKSNDIYDSMLESYNTHVVLFEKGEDLDVNLISKENQNLDSFDAKAKDLKVGAWLHIQDEKSNKIRAKISWINPMTGRYLLVNSNGLRLSDKSIQEIASGLRENKISILHTIPLFDRAMLEIAKQMNEAR